MKKSIFILLALSAVFIACRHKTDIKPAIVATPVKPDSIIVKPPDTVVSVYSGTTYYSNYLGARNRIDTSYADSAIVTIIRHDSTIHFNCSFTSGTYKLRADNNYSWFSRWNYVGFVISGDVLTVNTQTNASRGGSSYRFTGMKK